LTIQDPIRLAKHLEDRLCEYLETAYKIADPGISFRRSELLRAPGVIAQDPIVETTPQFAQVSMLRDLEISSINSLLPDLAAIQRPCYSTLPQSKDWMAVSSIHSLPP